MELMDQIAKLVGRSYRRVARPEEVPCHETSDPARLCANPLVSVEMTTFNHERYIRQAIEGVMMQKTDFEFELIIGEDASTDKTREICFEYQRKYPDKIRVLWSEHNVYPIGGNGVRVRAACRGKFITFCEGDDYWTNPDKLRLQVEAFKENPRLGMCLTATDVYYEQSGEFERFDSKKSIAGEFSAGHTIPNLVLFGKKVQGCKHKPMFYQTSGQMIRADVRNDIAKKYADVYARRMSFGDTSLLSFTAENYDVRFIPIASSVYRINGGSVSFSQRSNLKADLIAFKIYWLVRVMGRPLWLAYLRYALKIRRLIRRGK